MRVKKEDILFVLFCMITAVIFASYRYIVGDFVAYNGDFQNYNIFRRLLDGQVQYRDFTNYLGNGMVFVNYLLICLFRGFGESVFITNFTSSILYSLIICVSFYTIIHKRKKVYVITCLVAIGAFVILHAGFYGTFYYNYVYDAVFFEELGHSMRTTRAFLPFMLVGIFYVIRHFIKKENLLGDILCSSRWIIPVFLILGFLTVWSNDYGYASVACLFIIMILVNIFGKKTRFYKRILLYGMAVLSMAAGALISITIITHGSIMDYITASIGVTDYQFWYYGAIYDKYMTIADIFSDRRFVMLTIIFFAHAIYFLIGLIGRKTDDNSICKLFLHSTCYGASLIYVIGSGSHNYAPVKVITYILLTEWIGKAINKAVYYGKKIRFERFSFFASGKIFRKVRSVFTGAFRMLYENRMIVYILTMLLLYCISVDMLRENISYFNREEVKGLHVNSVLGSGLDEIAEKYSNEHIFSTYAGALETVNNVFQPTGTDYIIHVLGDEQRQKYIDNFIQGSYRYASTLKNEYTTWEYWVSRANWFFYRELYMNYEPVDETQYSVIWEKSKNKNTVETDVCLSWEYINESTCRIDLELPDYEDGAYIDLFLKYDVEWTQDRLKSGGIRKALCVQDGGEQYNSYNRNSCYYLREESEGCFIPVHVRNGKGYAYISAYPLSCTKLENVAVSVQDIIKEPVYALHVTNYTDMYRYIAADSVSQDGTLLKFDHTEYSATVLENAGQVKSGGETGIVESVWKDRDYIFVLLENGVKRNAFLYPNRIDVIKKEKVYTAVNYSDDEWICGVSRSKGEILIGEEIDIENLYAVRVGRVMKKIEKTDMTDYGCCLYLEDNSGVQIFAYPQEIELIYR